MQAFYLASLISCIALCCTALNVPRNLESTRSLKRLVLNEPSVPTSLSVPRLDALPSVPSPSRQSSDDTISRRDFFLVSCLTTAAVVTGAAEQSFAAEDAAVVASPGPAGTSSNATTNVDWKAILEKSKNKALGGGKAGASAAVVQVLALMWLRTSMNYQYRYGGSLPQALSTLWEQGGLTRLYQGLPFALVQGPATRFGDTAANTGILTLLDALPATHALPLPVKTACGSVAAGLWRVLLMPIDTSKTAMQVEGGKGLTQLWSSVLSSGPGPLYRGAVAQAAATAVGHFPWFITYNALNENIPTVEGDLFLTLVRSAGLGLASSCVSDCVSNSLRVIKTTKQTAQLNQTTEKELSYQDIITSIIEKDGVSGLFLRGLSTRLLINAIQGAAFSVLWRYFQQVS